MAELDAFLVVRSLVSVIGIFFIYKAYELSKHHKGILLIAASEIIVLLRRLLVLANLMKPYDPLIQWSALLGSMFFLAGGYCLFKVFRDTFKK